MVLLQLFWCCVYCFRQLLLLYLLHNPWFFKNPVFLVAAKLISFISIINFEDGKTVNASDKMQNFFLITTFWVQILLWLILRFNLSDLMKHFFINNEINIIDLLSPLKITVFELDLDKIIWVGIELLFYSKDQCYSSHRQVISQLLVDLSFQACFHFRY